MAVTKYCSSARDPAALKSHNPLYAQGRLVFLNAVVPLAAADGINSVYVMGNVPFSSLAWGLSPYAWPTLTGLTIFDIGLRNVDGTPIGAGKGKVIVDADDLAVAGTQTLSGHGTLTLAKLMQPLWQLAGLTSDPGGEVQVYGTAGAAFSTTGDAFFNLGFMRG